MENNEKFLYLEQFMEALEDLEPEDRYRATYCLCYYGLYRDFPDEATAVDKMYIKANAKLFDGQDKFLYKQKETGKLGGRPSALTDEQIWGAYSTLFKNKGVRPTEKEVIDFLGAGVKRIATRSAWKNREEHLYDCMKEVSYKDTEIHTSSIDF